MCCYAFLSDESLFIYWKWSSQPLSYNSLTGCRLQIHFVHNKERSELNKPCVSFFSSFSLSSESVTLFSSSKPLFPHFIGLSTYITHHFNISTCDVYKTCMAYPSYFIVHSPYTMWQLNIYKTWIACPSYFIVHSLHTRDDLTYMWLPPSVGLAQARPNWVIDHWTWLDYHITKLIGKSSMSIISSSLSFALILWSRSHWFTEIQKQVLKTTAV